LAASSFRVPYRGKRSARAALTVIPGVWVLAPLRPFQKQEWSLFETEAGPFR
jgi:hypothetical protein